MNGGTCPICDGGLSCCTVCGGIEGSLLPYCPGFKLTTEQNDRNYKIMMRISRILAHKVMWDRIPRRFSNQLYKYLAWNYPIESNDILDAQNVDPMNILKHAEMVPLPGDPKVSDLYE